MSKDVAVLKNDFFFSMALSAHSVPRSLIQFRNNISQTVDSLDEWSASRKAST
jgi:hypothetical protein